MVITDSKLKGLAGKKHTGPTVKLSDRDGLNVYHRKSGKLSFVFRYRFNGKPQDLVIGTYPHMTLADARLNTAECKRILSEGRDPKLEKNKEKVSKKITVEDALEYWIDNYVKKNRKNYHKIQAQFKKHIYPHIGNLSIHQCDTRDWVKVFDDISNGAYFPPVPKASGYILTNCKQALKFCRVRHYVISNALDDLTVNAIGEKASAKDRVLDDGELKGLWLWSHDIKNDFYYRHFILLLIVFGCRSQEIRLSEVSEWNLKEKIWTVSKHNSKTGIEIRRPIPDKIIPVISSLLESTTSKYLMGELKSTAAVSAYGRSLSVKLEHSKPWSLHDIRRTFTTYLNDFEFEPYIVEQLLGHTLTGVMKIYNKSQFMAKKRKALISWVDYLITYSGDCYE